jgi:alkanesulfonate monooxygenase SsuD/methylene tetrahydromethanopterin reductase-like flavin-dependent oxidoreductase (luciferase family)
VSLDHASGGRFELGIGWGSWADDFSRFGVDPPEPAARVRRQVPAPVGKIPVVIGGTGPKTLALVSEYADWWNVPVTQLDLLDRSRVRVVLRFRAAGHPGRVRCRGDRAAQSYMRPPSTRSSARRRRGPVLARGRRSVG